MIRSISFGTIIAVIAALTAIWSSYEAHLSRLEDERPYVKVEYSALAHERFLDGAPHPSPLGGFGDGMVPHIKLTIFGKTPALNISIDSDCIEGLANDHPAHPTNDVSYGMLFPSESGDSYCSRYLSGLQPDGSSQLTYLLEYWGMVHYRDIDGHDHQTPFCFEDDQLGQKIKQCEAYTAREEFR